MVKVGDKIRILKDRANSANVQKGDEFIVASLEGGGTVTVEGSANWTFNKSSYIVISQPVYSIPADTETVTLKYADGSAQDIDVKDRARGAPEWVKDGAWVVNKLTGVIARLSKASVGFNVQYLTDMSYIFSVSDVHERFRPFTNSDWKWGMWAEYEGEKVFVCSGELPFDLIRIDANPDGKIHTTLGSNGYVNISKLTPTTDP